MCQNLVLRASKKHVYEDYRTNVLGPLSRSRMNEGEAVRFWKAWKPNSLEVWPSQSEHIAVPEVDDPREPTE